ncbi:uncharacterized protein MYCFIDRAFT_212893 [Pseudocercospora fijiensis CIRAD86]|uniref:HTH La-type RNA-binding domain-containing protein n=1 Tax=Pseudocercospora fijiensis (strain CIRAD86) TaxID=383855 RepID=N1Q997_PSEFD|nr:uncharacterized protein MYCFIDRAFT_212893 [Pseudocercospora fijiensis CIRAD86]EME87463.1 hypothetical protein MYCFIDRAFT_212893 [Pseudocercospora fijiensis CIRAD86]
MLIGITLVVDEELVATELVFVMKTVTGPRGKCESVIVEVEIASSSLLLLLGRNTRAAAGGGGGGVSDGVEDEGGTKWAQERTGSGIIHSMKLKLIVHQCLQCALSAAVEYLKPEGSKAPGQLAFRFSAVAKDHGLRAADTTPQEYMYPLFFFNPYCAVLCSKLLSFVHAAPLDTPSIACWTRASPFDTQTPPLLRSGTPSPAHPHQSPAFRSAAGCERSVVAPASFYQARRRAGAVAAAAGKSLENAQVGRPEYGQCDAHALPPNSLSAPSSVAPNVMAASIQSPSGFSYAQAAKGHASTATSQTPSSKVNSGTATPATGNFSELGPNGNWADDVEASVGEKLESRKAAQESAKSVPAKDSAVERTKVESKVVNGTSGVSSPEPAVASSTSNTDDSSVPNTTTSSETTWETKSQNSEPSWIAERKERQNHDKTEKSDERSSRKSGKKGDKDAKEASTPKPEPKLVVLTESTPPAVNPWARRAEEQKARAVSLPQPSKPSPVASPAPANKENQKPQADARKKANSVTSIAREVDQPSATETKKPQGKRANVRTNVRQNSKTTTETARTDSTPPVPRAAQREAQSLPNLTAVPPPVKDEISWPTPDKADKAEDKDRKERPAEKEIESTGDADAAEAKPREKTKWTPYAVTPNIVWETEEMNRPRGSGERGGRGGASTRGRGGLRGGPNGSKGDRNAPRKEGSQSETDAGKETSSRDRSDVAERESMPPPPKPTRQSAADASRDGSRTRAQNQAKNSTHSISGGEGIAPSQKVTETYRTKSPENLEARDVKIPEPIPRQGSDAETTREAVDTARESSKKLSADSKKESRSFDQREWNGAPRGGKRNGRGRGGSREYTNGHQAAQAFVNGHADLTAAFGVPASYQSGRGVFGFSQQGRGSWRGSGPRSQSIPIDNTFPQRFATYGPAAQLPPVQTYYPGMYDFGGVPMTAMPYPPYIDHTYLMDMVSTQLEYYFSIDNLLKDMFLRKNMDSQGYVFLDIIANFNRIKHLTQDKELLKAVCLKSDNIDIRYGVDDGKLRLRKREGWDQFLLPKEQRDVSVQNDDPQELRRPEVPQQLFVAPPPPYRGPLSAGVPDAQHRRSFDPGYAVNGSQYHPFSLLGEQYGELTNGDDHRGRATKSPIRENSVSPGQSFVGASGHAHHEPDVFPDDQMHILTVVVKPSSAKQPHASRTFSNGSIDTRSIFTEMEKSNDEGAKPKTNGEPLVNGSSSPSISRHASPSHDRSPEKSNGKGYTLLWIKDKEIPTEQYPENSTHEPYHALRVRALSQREEAATGTCPYDLDVLYQFWSHFLIRNFNNKVYGEFKFFANNDAQERHNDTGLQNLVQFYAKALSSPSPIREHVVKDYVELVKNEPAILQGAAFKQLRQAYRDGALNVKNRKKLTDLLDQDMKDRLDA